MLAFVLLNAVDVLNAKYLHTLSKSAAYIDESALEGAESGEESIDRITHGDQWTHRTQCVRDSHHLQSSINPYQAWDN